jgi:RNA polymerase sigma factor (sigma-70 family)
MGMSNGAEGGPMSRRLVNPVLQFLRGLAGERTGDATDELLLRRFASGRDEAAFTALLQRHGRLVLGVCRRVLGNVHDAEDAFQATFLVLARQAATGFRPRALAGWLHGVAYRTAQRARKQAARRRVKEWQAVRAVSCEPPADAQWADVRRVLDEEIAGLPEKFRAPLVLCYLQGKTNAEAAEDLGCPKGTVMSRLATARERLRARLERRGVTLSVAALATLLAQELMAATLSPALTAVAARLALSTRAGAGEVAETASPRVEALTEGVVQSAVKIKIAAAVLLLLGGLALGGGLYARHAQQGPPSPTEGPRHGKPESGPGGGKQARADDPEPPWLVDPLPQGAVARLGWRVDWKDQSNGASVRAAFSPDGKLFAAADGPGVGLWEVATGKLLRRQRICPTFLHTLAFGPGNTLVCLANGSVHVWDVAAWKELRSFKVPDTWATAALSPDGQLLAMESHVWDVATGKKRYAVEGQLTRVSFSPDGRILLVSWTEHRPVQAPKPNGRLRVYEATTGKLLHAHDQPGQGLEFAVLAPDGRTVAAEGYDLTTPRGSYFVQLLDLQMGKELRRFAEGDAPRIRPAFSPDGKHLTVTLIGGDMHVWEVATGKPLRRLEREGGTGADTLLFSPDGSLVGGADRSGRAHLWDLKGGPVRCLAPGHWAWVGAVAFTPDGKSLISAAVDEVICWDLRRAAVTRSFKLKAPHLEEMVVAADGRHLLVRRGLVSGYDLQRGTEAAAFQAGEVWCFSADGGTLVRTGPPIPGFRCLPYKREPVADAHPFALTATGDILVERLIDPTRRFMVRGDGRSDYAGLRLRDTETGEVLATLKSHAARDHPPGAGDSPLVFSPDGKMMAGLVIPQPHGERTLVLWETQTGLERLRLVTVPKHHNMALAFSPDGRVLAYAKHYSTDAPAGPIHLLDLTLGKEAHKPLPAAPRCLAFSRDGKLLASGDEDTTVLLWDATGFAAAPRGDPLPVKEFDGLWADLAAPDGGRAYRAICRLLASPGPAVKLLRERVGWRDLAPEVDRLLADLGSDTFKAREQAAAALEALGDRARPFLKQALTRTKLSLEQRRRVEKVLSRLGAPFSSPAGIRLFRAMEVLERLGSAEGVELLRQIGAGPVDSPLTAEARRALRRMQ